MEGTLSPADVAILTGRNNNGGFGSGFGGDGWWILLLLLFANGGFNGGFGGFGGGADGMYPWLSNGQKDILLNTNNGFDTLHLSDQIEGTRDAIHGISNQICNSTADVTSAINNGFYGAEIAAANRQMADMNQMFNLSSQLAQCCCDNRLATCQTQNIVQNEANNTRFADANNTRDIITNATANTQAILDKLCQLELDAKNDKITDLERQLTMADLRASQTAQNAFISNSLNNEIDLMYNRLVNCPIPSTPVYRKNTYI